MSFQNTNFFVVHGWMINQLKLSGNDLNVYAVIYGFSQDEMSRYTGSLTYMASATGAGISTVQRILAKLVEKKLVCKQSYTTEDGMRCAYWVNPQFVPCSGVPTQHEQPLSQNEQGGIPKTTSTPTQNDHQGIPKMTNNNISIIII